MIDPRSEAPWTGGANPRDWQLRALPVAIDAIRAAERPLLSVATGSGKAYFAAALVRCALAGSGPIVVAVPTEALVEQLSASIAAHVGSTIVGRFYGGAKEADRRVVVACNPSLPKLAAVLPARPVLFLSDEAHRSETDAPLAFVEQTKPRSVVGLTATPHRTDGAALSLFSRCVFRYSLAEATRDGCLVPLDPRWWNGSIDDAVDVDRVCLDMVRDADGPGVLDAPTIDDAERFAALLSANGFPAEAVHSKRPDSAAVLERLRSGSLRAVVHVSMLVEGVDLPWLRWLCLRRPCGSVLRLTQHVGRVLRTHPGKSSAVLYDPHDTLRALGIDINSPRGLAAALDEAGEREAAPREPAAPAPVLLPPAVAVSELQQWARRALLELVAAGMAESPAGGGWRGGYATPHQLARLDKLVSVARWLPEGPRLAAQVCLQHGESLTAGQCADLIALLQATASARSRAIQRHGTKWPAVMQSIRKQMEAIPEPPEIAVESLRRAA